MTNRLRGAYTFRPEDLARLLRNYWLRGYITCMLDDEHGSDSFGDTESVYRAIGDELRALRRRKDGTWYQTRTSRLQPLLSLSNDPARTRMKPGV